MSVFVGFKLSYFSAKNRHAYFLRVSITQKWRNESIPKSVFGEAIATVVDMALRLVLKREILRFKMSYFEWKCQPMQTYSELGSV